jgi:SOS-response transcriptional repressor LexA
MFTEKSLQTLATREMHYLGFSDISARSASAPGLLKDLTDMINSRKSLPRMNISTQLVKNPRSTFMIRVTGDSMVNAGISAGDMLIVDKSVSINSGMIIVASINGELLVKRVITDGANTVLRSENIGYEDIIISDSDQLKIWGAVTSVIKAT